MAGGAVSILCRGKFRGVRVPLVALALALVMALVLAAPAHALSADEPPTVSSSHAILMDTTTGTVLFEQAADERAYPASTTKVMCALLVLEWGDLDDQVTIEQEDFDPLLAWDASTAGLMVGETISVRDLLACLLLPSGNEAAYALARYVTGDWQSFVALMNQRASELGCTNTHFENPCGLPDDNHYSSAHDLALILAEAIGHQEFCDITTSLTWDLPATNMNSARTIQNSDYLIDPESPAHTDGVIAGKTGYTSYAGRCLVTAAKNDNVCVVGVVLGASNIADESGVTPNFYDMQDLLTWGLTAWKTVEIVSAGDELSFVEVRLSSDGDTVGALSTGSITATVPVETDKSDLTVETFWTEELTAPVEAGTDLGQAIVSLGERVLGQVGLVTAGEMRLSIPDFILDWLSDPLHVLFVVAIVVVVCLVVAIIARSRAERRRSESLAARARIRRRDVGVYGSYDTYGSDSGYGTGLGSGSATHRRSSARRR